MSGISRMAAMAFLMGSVTAFPATFKVVCGTTTYVSGTGQAAETLGKSPDLLNAQLEAISKTGEILEVTNPSVVVSSMPEGRTYLGMVTQTVCVTAKVK